MKFCLIHAITWMNLESQTQRGRYCMKYKNIGNIENRQIHRDKSTFSVYQGLKEEGIGNFGLMGTEFLFGVMENI